MDIQKTINYISINVGENSQTSNLTILRALYRMGIPAMGKTIIAQEARLYGAVSSYQLGILQGKSKEELDKLHIQIMGLAKGVRQFYKFSKKSIIDITSSIAEGVEGYIPFKTWARPPSYTQFAQIRIISFRKLSQTGISV